MAFLENYINYLSFFASFQMVTGTIEGYRTTTSTTATSSALNNNVNNNNHNNALVTKRTHNRSSSGGNKLRIDLAPDAIDSVGRTDSGNLTLVNNSQFYYIIIFALLFKKCRNEN